MFERQIDQPFTELLIIAPAKPQKIRWKVMVDAFVEVVPVDIDEELWRFEGKPLRWGVRFLHLEFHNVLSISRCHQLPPQDYVLISCTGEIARLEMRIETPTPAPTKG